MGVIAPSQGEHHKGIAARPSYVDQKRWISNEFYQALNEFTIMDNGMRVTKIQGAVRSVVDSMIDPEADPYYRLAALKFVTEHLEGKASAMKDETNEEMPKLVIAVDDSSASEIIKAAKEIEADNSGITATITDEDGSDPQEVIV